MELLEKPPKCILRLLSEECKIPKGTDGSFVAKIHTEFAGHAHYVRGENCRRWQVEFGVRHYAGEVMYQVDDFLAKNKDAQQDQLFEIMLASNNAFVRTIATLQDTTESIYGTIGRGVDKGSKGRPLVADAFRQQLSALVDLLSATRPWYVRCIKPNLTKSPRAYDVRQVHTQLRYLGMLDIIRIRREGFPTHFTFDAFIGRFRCLLLAMSKSSSSSTTTTTTTVSKLNLKPTSISVRELLNRIRIDPTLWQIGHSKVFFKASAADDLEERRTVLRTRMAVRLQSAWRRVVLQRQYTKLRLSAIVIERAWRAVRDRLAFQRKRRAAITIQAWVRGTFAREVVRALRRLRMLEAEAAQRKLKEEKEEAAAAAAAAAAARQAEEEEVNETGSDTNSAGSARSSLAKRSSTPDELDELERQLQMDAMQFYNVDVHPPPPPPPPPLPAPNYEEIEEMAKVVNAGTPIKKTLINGKSMHDTNNNRESSVDDEDEEHEANNADKTNNISAQFEQLIHKAELAIDSLDKINIPPPKTTTSTGTPMLTSSPKVSNAPNRRQPADNSLADKLKFLLIEEETEAEVEECNKTHSPLPPPSWTSSSPPPSISSNDFGVSGAGDGSSASSDTLMMAASASASGAIKEDHDEDDAGSIASSSIFDGSRAGGSILSGQGPALISEASDASSGATSTQMNDDSVSMTTANSDLDTAVVGGGSPFIGDAARRKMEQPNRNMKQFDEMSSSSAATTGSSGSSAPQQQQQLVYGANVQKLMPQMPQQQQYSADRLPGPSGAIFTIKPQQPPAQSLATQPAFNNSKFIAKQIEAHQMSRQTSKEEANGGVADWDSFQEKNFELTEFALKYFNNHPREAYTRAAAGGKKARKPLNMETQDFLSHAEMVTWTPAPGVPTSHVHLHDPQNVILACAFFKELVKYLAGEKKPELEVRFIQTVIGHGIEREELRDEVFVQLVRQSNDNPNKDQVVRCWALLALATAAFVPSKAFSRYLLTYLRRHLRAHTSIACYAQFCLDNLHAGRLLARRYPPSVAEVKAVTALRSLVCRFHLLDGRTKAIDLHPADTAADAVHALATKLNLRNVDGWAIFESTPDGERVLKSHDYVADILTLWEIRLRAEQQKQAQAQQSKGKGSTKESASNASLFSLSIGNAEVIGSCRFVFKKRLFRSTNEIPRDPVEVSLLYAQAVHSVVKLDEFPVSERIALQLAGLQAQVSMGDFQVGRIRGYEDVENYISARVRRAAGHSSMEWAVKIADAHRLYGTGKAALVAKVWYLSLVLQYPLYGAALFPAQYKGLLALFGSSPLLLGIHSSAILVVAAADKRVLATYKYADIESVNIYPAESLVSIRLFKEMESAMMMGTTTAGLSGQHKCLTFETSQNEEVASLIAAYSPAHALALAHIISGGGGGAPEAMGTPAHRGPRRLLKMTLEDRLRLHTEVINARRALVLANIMRKPRVGETSAKWKTTLRRLGGRSKKTGAGAVGKEVTFDDDDYSGDEVLRNYPRSFWAYIKEPLPSSLLVISDLDLEASAVTMFEQILAYSGLHNNESSQSARAANGLAPNGNLNGSDNGSTSGGSGDEEWCIRSNSEQTQIRAAQAILEKCLGADADIVRNEFFLQLIRQTTDHPEPNSRVNIRHWQLLALACSLTQPSDRRVLAYLHAHLRRCALDQVTREGQYAQFALKNLQGTLETRGRRLAPSRPEIAATIQCRRVYARVHFLDGHCQAVEFDACAVIAEVLEQIQLKIELRAAAPGYALYQGLGPNGGEQALQPEDKVGDAIAFWERWHDQHNSRVYGATQAAGQGATNEPVHYFIFKVRQRLFGKQTNINDFLQFSLLHQNHRNTCKWILTSTSATLWSASCCTTRHCTMSATIASR